MTLFGPIPTTRLAVPNANLPWKVLAGLSKDTFSNVILYSFSETDVETIDIRRCFDETNHIFAFGRDTGKSVFTVDLMLFFGEICGGAGGRAELSTIKGLYSKNRIYKNPNPISITVANRNLSGYLIQMTVGQVDSRSQSCMISFTFIVDQEV